MWLGAALLALAVSSCSGGHDSALEAFGEAEPVVVAVDGKLVENISDITSGVGAIFVEADNPIAAELQTIASLKGLETKMFAMKQNMIVGVVKDDSDLQKSLEANGIKPDGADHGDSKVFVAPGRKVFYIVADDYLRVVPAVSVDKALATVRETEETAKKPMPEWRVKLLENSDNQVRAFARYDDSTAVTVAADFSVGSANINIYNVNSNAGTAVNWLPDGSYSTVAPLVKNLDENATVSVALAPCNYSLLGRSLAKLRIPGLTYDFMDALSHTVSGPVWGNVYFDGDNITELDRLSARATVTATSKTMATGMLMGCYGMLGNFGLAPGLDQASKSLTANVFGARFKVSVSDNVLNVATVNATPAKTATPQDAADCLLWASLNLSPAIMSFVADTDTPVKVRVAVRADKATVTVESKARDEKFF